jgi:hypothetical protein
VIKRMQGQQDRKATDEASAKKNLLQKEVDQAFAERTRKEMKELRRMHRGWCFEPWPGQKDPDLENEDGMSIDIEECTMGEFHKVLRMRAKYD